MDARKTVGLAALLVCAASGCGTIGNLSNFSQAQPFGGAWRDVRAAQDLYVDAAAPLDKSVEEWSRYALATPFLALDLPLSLAADAATLPLTLPLALYRSVHPEPAASKKARTPP